MGDTEPSSNKNNPENPDPNGPGIASYPARSAVLGGGLSVQRALPLWQRRLVGAWCFADHFGPLNFRDRKIMDVAPHPHMGLQTVSWLFEGEVLHKDSLGFEALARPGGLNLMTAGRAIAHSEETPERNSGKLHGLQLWLALPEGERHRQPSFDHYPELPVLEPGGGRVHLFMGELAGQRSPARAFSPIVGAEIALGSNASMNLPLNPAWEHALFIIDGLVLLDGQPLSPGALHYLGTGRSVIEMRTTIPSRAALIGGPPFGEPVLIWWNFVARSADEIQMAREDWEQHRRFGEVRAYKGERL
ncbi:MAG: pirin family protein, partial [Gammaproteobacteria bacterium]|nr:pirin family protein [Gammaproteobacteria bacterium]